MNIDTILYEVDNLEKELSRLNKQVSGLRKRRTELVGQVITELQDSGEESVVRNGKTYKLTELSKRSRKSDKKKREDALLMLQEEGMERNDAEEMYDKLNNVLKGEEVVKYALKPMR